MILWEKFTFDIGDSICHFAPFNIPHSLSLCVCMRPIVFYMNAFLPLIRTHLLLYCSRYEKRVQTNRIQGKIRFFLRFCINSNPQKPNWTILMSKRPANLHCVLVDRRSLWKHHKWIGWRHTRSHKTFAIELTYRMIEKCLSDLYYIKTICLRYIVP